MAYRTYFIALLLNLSLGCDLPEVDAKGPGGEPMPDDGCTSTGEPASGSVTGLAQVCPEGHEWVADEADCYQDVACFPSQGGFCTGACPILHELDWEAMTCVPSPNEGCLPNFEPVASQADCAAGASCYDRGAGWCTGVCPGGRVLVAVEFTGYLCMDPDQSPCLPGFDNLFSDHECLPDAECYPAPFFGTTCTGYCPEGMALDLTGGPHCQPI